MRGISFEAGIHKSAFHWQTMKLARHNRNSRVNKTYRFSSNSNSNATHSCGIILRSCSDYTCVHHAIVSSSCRVVQFLKLAYYSKSVRCKAREREIGIPFLANLDDDFH